MGVAMADDIANFGLSIDSSQAKKAKQDLDALSKSGPAVERALDQVSKGGQGAGSALNQMASQAKRAQSSFKWLLAGGALIGGASLLSMFGRITRATQAAQEAQGQLAAVLKSTGEAAGLTQTELTKLAASLEATSVFAVDDIIQGETHLLAYANIAGEQIPRAMQAVIDTASRMGMSVVSAAETVGRALDIPSQGMASLTRQGFRFTDAEKALVKSLEDAGRVSEAQGIILKALEESYGGAARAARDTFGGALSSLQNTIDGLLSGQAGGLPALTNLVNGLNDVLRDERVPAALDALGTALQVVAVAAGARMAVALGASAIAFASSAAAAYTASAAYTATALASTRAAVAAGTLAAAARGLGLAIRFMTGPLGIALTAIGFVASALFSYKSEADAAVTSTNALTGAIDLSAGALERMSQAQRDSAAQKLRDQLAGAVDEAGRLNVRVEKLAKWVNSRPAGDTMMSVWKRELVDLQAEADTANQAVANLARQLQSLANFQPPAADPLAGYRTALDQYMDKYATRKEQLTKALADAKRELGPLFNGDIEGRIRDRYKDPVSSGGGSAARVSGLDSVIKKLREEQATFGMSRDAAERYRIATMDGTEAQRAQALALFDSSQAMRDAKRETDQAIESAKMYAAAQEEIAAFEAQKALDVASVGYGDRLRDQLQEEIAIRQQYAQRRRQLEEAQQSDSTRISEKAYEDRLQIIQNGEDAQIAIIRQKAEEKRAAESDWTQGALRALQNYYDESMNAAAMAGDAITNAFKGAEDAFVEFVKTGKVDFKSLADSIIADLARIAIKKMLLGPLAGALGLGGGGGTGSLLGGGGLQGIASIGFDAGGYTGDGAKFQPAGIVHRGEGVLSQSEIRAIGGEAGFNQLRRAIRGPGHASGGMAGRPSLPGGTGSGQPVNITMIVNTPDANSFKKSQSQIERGMISSANRALARN